MRPRRYLLRFSPPREHDRTDSSGVVRSRGCRGPLTAALNARQNARQEDDEVLMMWPTASGRLETSVVFEEGSRIHRGRVSLPHKRGPYNYRSARTRLPLSGCNRSLLGAL